MHNANLQLFLSGVLSDMQSKGNETVVIAFVCTILLCKRNMSSRRNVPNIKPNFNRSIHAAHNDIFRFTFHLPRYTRVSNIFVSLNIPSFSVLRR